MPARTHVDLTKLREERSDEDQITGLVAGTPAADAQASPRAVRVVAVPISQVLPDRFQTASSFPLNLNRPSLPAGATASLQPIPYWWPPTEIQLCGSRWMNCSCWANRS